MRYSSLKKTTDFIKRITLILALIISTTAFAQVDTETHRFWQPGVQLTFDDFQGVASESAYIKKLSDLHIYHQIATGYWSALDIPKSQRGWKKGLQEKYYFCAAMEKSNSFYLCRSLFDVYRCPEARLTMKEFGFCYAQYLSIREGNGLR